MSCLFCNSDGPFNTVEHIIPESLGNDDLTLKGHVCDDCQRYFGAKVEQYVLSKSPIAAWRVLLGTTTKKGKRPKVDLSQPRDQRGALPRESCHNDDLALEVLEDESVQISKMSPELAAQVERGESSRFNLVLTPLMLHMLGRFLCKVGLEFVCLADPVEARSPRYDAARTYARRGPTSPLWPILWYESGRLDQLKIWRRADQGLLVESECYSYWLAEVGQHRIFEFGIGTDQFIVALDEPMCCMLLEAQIADPACKVLWYPPESATPGSTPHLG